MSETSSAPTGRERGAARPRSAFYRACWRWHFYAGLLCIPIIALLCLSGIVWLFKPQIDALAYGHLRHVEPRAGQLSYDAQLAAVRRAYPGGSPTRLGPPPAPDRSTQFDVVTRDGRDLSVFVDPHDARVLGARDNGRTLAQLSLELHGSLLTGRWLGDEKWGDRVIELVSGWTLVLVVTGLVLWWPRGRDRSFRAALRPRWRGRHRRISWRDLHAVTGVTFSLITLFFLVTGLMWTGTFGSRYSEKAVAWGAGYPAAITDGVPSKRLADLAAGNGKLPWAAGQLPVPLSGEQGSPRWHSGHHGSGRLAWDPRGGAPLDAIVAQAQRLHFKPGYAIFFPADERDSYSITVGPDLDPAPVQSALDERTAFVDQRDASVLQQTRFGQYGPMAMATNWGISLHEGREWGLASQLLMLAGTLAILLSLATSVVMWRKRRPSGLGAPRRPLRRRATLMLVAIVGALGLLFPLLGYSLIAVLALELALLRRIPRVARALGG